MTKPDLGHQLAWKTKHWANNKRHEIFRFGIFCMIYDDDKLNFEMWHHALISGMKRGVKVDKEAVSGL